MHAACGHASSATSGHQSIFGKAPDKTEVHRSYRERCFGIAMPKCNIGAPHVVTTNRTSHIFDEMFARMFGGCGGCGGAHSVRHRTASDANAANLHLGAVGRLIAVRLEGPR